MDRARTESHEWLTPFMARLLEVGPRVLELGCGPGQDARVLVEQGFRVVACDLRLDPPPGVPCFLSDLRDPLPIRSAAVDVVVAAGLCLQYFPREATLRVFGEVHRVLRDGGRFLLRVNATDDVAHGAADGDEVEPRLRCSAHGSNVSSTRRTSAEP